MLLIAGTGTDVGKTFVTCALTLALRRRGLSPVAWKPVATGAPGGDGALHPDVVALSRAMGSPAPLPRWSFEPPLSPHLAARKAGVELDLDAIVWRARALAEPGAPVLLETAGGLFSPVSTERHNAHLALALGWPVLLVAPDRIGVIHDVAATTLAARSLGLSIAALALSAPAEPDPSTGTNAAEIEACCGLATAAVFARSSVDAPGTVASAEATLGALGLPGRRG